jgi:hypothetical protein
MPVIVIGADTSSGMGVIDALYRPDREIRAFVSDESVAAGLRLRAIKVALGDVSDDTHIEAAATRCFTAVLMAEAAEDDRERSFSDSAGEVLAGWGRAIGTAGVTRAIWVMAGQPPPSSVPETAVVDPARLDLAETVAALDDARTL